MDLGPASTSANNSYPIVEHLDLEFRNNGLIDSLTGSMAPSLFIENLTREIAAIDRYSASNYRSAFGTEGYTFSDTGKVSVISLSLDISQMTFLMTDVATQAEITLVHWSHIIASHIRREEFFSRISNTGFWWFVRGDVDQAHKALDRVSGALEEVATQKFQGTGTYLKSGVIERSTRSTIADFLSEIDAVHFSSAPG